MVSVSYTHLDVYKRQTLDGANIEIKDNVGIDNIFIFGKTAQQVDDIRKAGYKPSEIINSHAELAQALHEINDGLFSPDDPNSCLLYTSRCV